MIFDATEKVMPVWKIYRVDPGFIYVIESHGRYKIGKTKWTKDRLKAAMWAARSGQVFGWALFVVGAYLVLARRDYSWLWFIILGWFLTSAATAENQQAVVQSRLRTVAVREIMTRRISRMAAT